MHTRTKTKTTGNNAVTVGDDVEAIDSATLQAHSEMVGAIFHNVQMDHNRLSLRAGIGGLPVEVIWSPLEPDLVFVQERDILKFLMVCKAKPGGYRSADELAAHWRRMEPGTKRRVLIEIRAERQRLSERGV